MSVEVGPWPAITVAEAIVAMRGHETRKLKTPEYQPTGSLPIIDQGSELVCGYTDDLTATYPYELPVIVFGDHTRALKFVDFPFAIGADGTKCLHPNESFDPQFFYYALCSLNLRGEGYARHFKMLKEKRIPVPPIEEQRRIVSVLRSVDEAIQAGAASVQQATRIELGLLQDLMTLGLSGIGPDASTNGQAPAEWKEHTLDEVVADPITYGVVQPGDYLEDGIRLVRGGDFPNGKIEIDDLPRISRDVTRSYRRSELRGGEIVVSLVGYPGACAQVPLSLAGANISRSAALIRPGKYIDGDFLFHFLRSPIGQKRILRSSIGSAQQVVNLKDLKKITFCVPSLDEQREIASILNSANQFLTSEALNLNSLQALKGEVASDLLSGRVRVPA